MTFDDSVYILCRNNLYALFFIYPVKYDLGKLFNVIFKYVFLCIDFM